MALMHLGTPLEPEQRRSLDLLAVCVDSPRLSGKPGSESTHRVSLLEALCAGEDSFLTRLGHGVSARLSREA